MDDGYKSGKGLYICTESYTIEEHKTLVIMLKNKFDLKVTYHKTTNGFRIYIHSVSKDLLVRLIKPHGFPHFLYKII